MADDDVELGSSDVVFRFHRVRNAFVPTGQNIQNGELFTPSSIDKSEAEKNGTTVQLTVWDLAWTTLEQAKRIWGQEADAIAFGLALADVLEIRQFCNRQSLRVLRDPLPQDAGPGHAGHCGFEGLEKQPGENKRVLKTLRDELAQRCFAIKTL
jgi:hypothetical protein